MLRDAYVAGEYRNKPTKVFSFHDKSRDANPLQNGGWFGLWVSKTCHFGFGFGFRVFKNLSLDSGSGFENFPKKRILGLGWVLKKNIKIPAKFP